MTSLTVARDTWNWLKATGRISGIAEQKILAMGETEFLQQAAEKWEMGGSLRFMQGMKDVILEMIWNE